MQGLPAPNHICVYLLNIFCLHLSMYTYVFVCILSVQYIHVCMRPMAGWAGRGGGRIGSIGCRGANIGSTCI